MKIGRKSLILLGLAFVCFVGAIIASWESWKIDIHPGFEHFNVYDLVGTGLFVFAAATATATVWLRKH